MNIISLKKHSRVTSQKVLGTCLLAAILALPGCGGSSSTTALQNTLPSPVAGAIKGEVLEPAPAGKPPVVAAELAALPIITLNQRQFSDPNVLLNLNGTVTAAAGATIVTTLWTQVTGPTVRIPSPLQLNNEIIIPDVAVATTLEFRLTAQDSNGKINSATVSILVKPMPAFVKVIGGVFNEADKVAVFTLRLNAASNLPVTFSYSTQDGTALNGSDYTLTAGQIIFAAGEISKTLSVPLLDDTLTEDDETFSLHVTAMDGDAAHSNSGIAIIHSSSETLLPQLLSFITPVPAVVKVNTQYSNPLAASPGTGAVLYTSSNLQVATVDGNGLVTTLTPGSTTITARKAGDTIYSAAEASYGLIVSHGKSPFVSIFTGDADLPPYHLTAKLGELLSFYGSEEAVSEDNDHTHSWSSDIDGLLWAGTGHILYTNSLTQGLHVITETIRLSDGTIRTNNTLVGVGDITHLATILDSVTPDCPYVTFYEYPAEILDRIFNSYHQISGCVDNEVGTTSLIWPSAVTINTIDLYTSAASPLQNYIIEYLDKPSGIWKTLARDTSSTASSSSSTGDSSTDDIYKLELHHHAISEITTEQLRIVQPQPGGIAELVVFGAEKNPSVLAEKNPRLFSIQLGEPFRISGDVFDAEDSQMTQQPQTPLPFWSSNIDGAFSVGHGDTLATNSLSQGLHLLTFTATDSDGNTGSDSVAVLVGNVAPLAVAEASQYRCWAHPCYLATNINDSNLSSQTGYLNSWVNLALDFYPDEPQWVSLTWASPITTDTLDLFTTFGRIIQGYDIEYLDATNNWLKVVSVTGNASVHRSHVITPITTSQIRVVVTKGSVEEPTLGHISELVVFGTQAAATSSSSLSASSSSSTSSSSSSIASSSTASSSLDISAILFSSAASSSFAP